MAEPLLSLPPQTLESFLRADVRFNRNMAYCDAASLAILLYDYILTLNQEVKYIWPSQWSLTKWLYLFTRYPVFIDAGLLSYYHFFSGDVVDPATCRSLYIVAGWFIFAGVGLAQLVLTFRTYAIWGRDKRIAAFLIALIIVAGIPSAFLTKRGLESVLFIASPVPTITGCFPTFSNQNLLMWDYIAILVVETITIVLMVTKGFSYYRHTTSTMVSTLFKDGIIYFIFLAICSTANVIVLALTNHMLGASLILLQRVLHSLFTSRILINLRAAASQEHSYESSSRRSAMPWQANGVLSTAIVVSTAGWVVDVDLESRGGETEDDASWKSGLGEVQ